MLAKNIKDAFSQESTKCILRVKIVKQTNFDTFIVADNSMCCLMDTELTPNFSKDVCIGQFIQITFPNISKENKVVYPTKKPDILKHLDMKINMKEAEKLAKLMASLPSTSSSDSNDDCGGILKFLETKPNNFIVEHARLKVCQAYPARTKSTNKDYLKVHVKDKANNKNILNLYQCRDEDLEVGEVYDFRKLKVSNYKIRPDDKFRCLNSGPGCNYKKSATNAASQFSNIIRGDGQSCGTIIAFDMIKLYKPCTACNSAVEEESNICKKCSISQDPSIDTNFEYRFTMIVETKDQEENMDMIFGFRRHLTKEPNKMKTEEDLREELENHYLGKNVIVDYEHNLNSSNPMKTIIDVKFVENTSV